MSWLAYRQKYLGSEEQSQYSDKDPEEDEDYRKIFQQKEAEKALSRLRLIPLEEYHSAAKKKLVNFRPRKMNSVVDTYRKNEWQTSDSSQVLKSYLQIYNKGGQVNLPYYLNKYTSKAKQRDSYRKYKPSRAQFERYQPQYNDREMQYITQKVIKEQKRRHTENTLQEPLVYFPIISNKRIATLEETESRVWKRPERRRSTILGMKYQKLSRISVYRKKVLMRKFKAVARTVLFTIYMRSFRDKIRPFRKHLSRQFSKQRIQQQLKSMRQQFTDGLKHFFLTVLDHYEYILKPLQTQNYQQHQLKVKSIHRLSTLALDCLKKTVDKFFLKHLFADFLYFTCKHGSFGSHNYVYTAEQMILLSISEEFGSLQADRFLEQSAMILLVFIKMVVFNVLLKPQEIDWKSIIQWRTFNKIDIKTFFTNISLIGNVLYELFISIQDELLERSCQAYILDNWGSVKNKFNFKIAESMIIDGAKHQEKELISGLWSHKYVLQTFKISQMTEHMSIVREMLGQLHQSMSTVHQKVVEKYWSRNKKQKSQINIRLGQW